ncbi:uncharacterized protein BDV17DRAFT_288345 [Aspergillus undulatus]|uniref:uncharacterized protein n=1 Tax=Aspergillus undulatus TaxID=1810928 RepID=UPI003CCD35E6
MESLRNFGGGGIQKSTLLDLLHSRNSSSRHSTLTEQNGLGFTFFIGATQGQGVPSEPSTPGLAVHLVYGETTISGGVTLNGTLPVDDPSDPNFHLSEIGTFMHPHEDFGPRKLIGAVAAGVVSAIPERVSDQGDESFTVTIGEDSLVHITEHVVGDGQLFLNSTAPSDHEDYTIFAIYERYTIQRAVDPALGATTPRYSRRCIRTLHCKSTSGG